MGYYHEGLIRCFEPDNTPEKLHIPTFDISTVSLEELMDQAREHFGDVDPGRIKVTAEHIHTKCLGYDAYDPTDWTDYLVLEIEKET